MKTLLTTISFVLTIAAGTAFSETTVRMLKTWDTRYPGSLVICDRYADLLAEASGGEIVVHMFGPETIPPLEQLEPAQLGLFQVLCTYPGFHTGAATLLTGLESIKTDPPGFRASGALDVIRESYEALGLHVISVPLGHGYWIYLNKPLTEKGDLDGLQIRALPPQHPYIQSIGGTPVVLPPAEMFSALERGVVDGAWFPAAGATGYGFQEVTNRYFDASASSPHVILANQAFWEGLPDKIRTVFEEQAIVLEDEIPSVYQELNMLEREKLAAAGVEFLTLDDEVAARLADGIREGAWAYAATRNTEAAAQLRSVLEAADMLR